MENKCEIRIREKSKDKNNIKTNKYINITKKITINNNQKI